ncbi:MAG: NAD(P)/FAD-dependent oxidoreductase [Halothiobacillaceae bacterium]
MAHIVILGAGLGGLPAAYEARETLGKEHQITVVNGRDHFQFIPSNPWVAVGWRNRDDVTLPIEPALTKKGIGFIHDRVTAIDPVHSTLRLAGDGSLDYDYLVICTGPKLRFDQVPGTGPDSGHTQSICSLDHAEQAYLDYKRLLEDPGPVVVGALPGTSCFGPAYEYLFILDSVLRKRKLRHKVPITFVTPEPYLGHFGLGGVGDSRGLMETQMRSHDIHWMVNARVQRAECGRVHVEQLSEDGERVIKDHDLPFHHAMLMPAFGGVDVVAGTPRLSDENGFVHIDPFQRSPAYHNIFAAGVCVSVPPVEKTPVPTGAPKTGYMTESMVSALVRNIAAELDGQPATHRGSWQAICLADMGDRGAAFVALPQMPPRNVNWFATGKWVHFAKIAFEKYFLRKMRKGTSEPLYERYILRSLGIQRLDND